jgi:GT2 family glycosyltransferase
LFSLSIVIPTHNGLHHLQRCLPSVRRHAPPGTQIVVVDDASTDGTVDWVRQKSPEIDLVALSANQGFCRAGNAGLEHARGDVIELLNNDTEVCSGWAQAALADFADSTIGSVAPLVLRMNDPDRIDSCGQDYHLCGWAIARGYGQRLQPKHLIRGEVFGASASSGFYRRTALDRTGGFLPEYEAYLEDTDLAFRLRWAGFRCVYQPASRVLHSGSASYSRTSERVCRLLARNEEFNFWINLPTHSLLRGLVPHLGFVLVRALRQAAGGQLYPYVRGKLQALAAWKWICQRRRKLCQSGHRYCSEWKMMLNQQAEVLRYGWQWIANQQLP